MFYIAINLAACGIVSSKSYSISTVLQLFRSIRPISIYIYLYSYILAVVEVFVVSVAVFVFKAGALYFHVDILASFSYLVFSQRIRLGSIIVSWSFAFGLYGGFVLC